MSVSATDADDPMTENAFLSYSIIGQESIPAGAINKVMFGINNQTGAIYTRDVGLDREVKCSISLRNKLSQIITAQFIQLICPAFCARWWKVSASGSRLLIWGVWDWRVKVWLSYTYLTSTTMPRSSALPQWVSVIQQSHVVLFQTLFCHTGVHLFFFLSFSGVCSTLW